jgi:hypothetical protein
MTLTKQELADAAVAIVQERADEQSGPRFGYTEAYHVATALQRAGLITHPDTDSKISTAKEAARKSLEGKTKRLLDEAAGAGRILRFSSRDHKVLPYPDGRRRAPYGNTVYYTTAELHQSAEAACEAADAAWHDQLGETAELLRRSREAGAPEPSNVSGTKVTYDLDGFRVLVAQLEQTP